MRAVDTSSRLLLVAPTGSGKTLMSNLVVALLAHERPLRHPRVLVVVPSRSLLVQHVADAQWLQIQLHIPIHMLAPELSLPMVRAVLAGAGVVYTTPITLIHRLSSLGGEPLQAFDCAIFDEIDTYVTAEELDERRDTWPALEACLESGLPVLGFTGTHLSTRQEDVWRGYGFHTERSDISLDWMPFTRVVFERIDDSAIRNLDSAIREELRKAYRTIFSEYGRVTWSGLKKLAYSGDPSALHVLKLCGDRLRLFESPGSEGGKLKSVLKAAADRGPALILSRYRDSAAYVFNALVTAGIKAWRADGGMPRDEIAASTFTFREQACNESGALVITRALGGRGLDFPNAQRAVMVSPRSNYQTVAQELARIRSRHDAPKEAKVLYYEGTEEEAKARRLGSFLKSERYGEHALFEVIGLPSDSYRLEPFESRNLRNEESLNLYDS
jgi:superfamily II DNA or RNA helicase